MKAEAQVARSALESARAFVQATRAALDELRLQRKAIITDREALEARHAPWPEVVTERVRAAIADRASSYTGDKGWLATWIRKHNPNLERRGGYDELPFFGDGDPEVQQAAQCILFPQKIEETWCALLLEFPPPFPSEQCVSGKDRATQLAALDEQSRVIDGDIERLEAELRAVTGDAVTN